MKSGEVLEGVLHSDLVYKVEWKGRCTDLSKAEALTKRQPPKDKRTINLRFACTARTNGLSWEPQASVWAAFSCVFSFELFISQKAAAMFAVCGIEPWSVRCF